LGIFGFFQTGGWSLGPTVGGLLLDNFPTRPHFTWGVIGCIAMTAAALFFSFARRLPQAADVETSPLEAKVEHAAG
jgi:MFS family permease